MTRPKYPRKPLLDHREKKVDDAALELGAAVRAREAAEAHTARAERERDEAEARAAAVRAAEEARLLAGDLRVVDLARAQAWEVAAGAERSAHERAVSAAEDREADARSGESAARGELAQKMADRDVVRKDEERFRREVDRRVLAAEEEGAEEAFQGALHRAKRGEGG